MGIALFAIGILLVVGGGVFLGMNLVKSVKHPKKALQKEHLRFFGVSFAAILVGGMLGQWGIHEMHGWASVLTWYQQGMAILGGGLLMLSIAFLATCFVLRYFKTRITSKWLKKVKIGLYASIPAVFLSFILFEEGAAHAWGYPLISGFGIGSEGFYWAYPSTGHSGFNVAWYGIFILGGFLTAYTICDHRFYRKFGKHGILENCLIVVFIFGILGARLWYVVGNWNGDLTGGETFAERVAKGDILSIFAFWEGGLTVLGGVIAGIVSGWIYVKLFRKYVPVTFALDVVVPSILVAQAIGRWGNFFNHEVYGAEVAISDGWWWLPTFIQKEMGYTLADGKIYVPLFLIEGMINLAGFFLIYFGVPALWKARPNRDEFEDKVRDVDLSNASFLKRMRYTRAPGVLAGFYLMYYGVVRMVMEPLRDPAYNMGTNGSWSFWNAMIYIILGVVLIALLQVYEYFLREKVEAWKQARAEAKGAPVMEGPSEEKAPTMEEPSEEINPKEEASIIEPKEDEKTN
ncbi:MAG: prolipoprotein diacylglyceryl transferase [Bacilli bacterium]|nr:prolipoprotein diacylglyceryl transferase [Bacilli bacterium]